MALFCMKTLLYGLLTSCAVMHLTESGAFFTPLCAPACAVIIGGGIGGGIGGVQAALTASGVGIPAAAGVAAAVAAAGPGGLSIAGCTLACVSALLAVTCFDEHSYVDIVLRDGSVKHTSIYHVQPGDVLRSLDEERAEYQRLSTVKHVMKIVGNFQFYEFDLETEQRTSINVTAPHMMILCRDTYRPGYGNRLTMKPAHGVVVGDAMIFTDISKGHTSQECVKVKEVKSFYAREKINVETDTGTLIANGVFVTGICENNGGKEGDAIGMLSKYRVSHGYA